MQAFSHCGDDDGGGDNSVAAKTTLGGGGSDHDVRAELSKLKPPERQLRPSARCRS